jgi:hypothetical protein
VYSSTYVPKHVAHLVETGEKCTLCGRKVVYSYMSVGFKALALVNIEITVFWDVTQCSLVEGLVSLCSDFLPPCLDALKTFETSEWPCGLSKKMKLSSEPGSVWCLTQSRRLCCCQNNTCCCDARSAGVCRVTLVLECPWRATGNLLARPENGSAPSNTTVCCGPCRIQRTENLRLFTGLLILLA